MQKRTNSSCKVFEIKFQFYYLLYYQVDEVNVKGSKERLS